MSTVWREMACRRVKQTHTQHRSWACVRDAFYNFIVHTVSIVLKNLAVVGLPSLSLSHTRSRTPRHEDRGEGGFFISDVILLSREDVLKML